MNIYNLINDNSATVTGPDGKDNIPANNEPVPVKGKPGKDKVPAVVPEGTFVVPKENAPVAVKLSKDEVLIPPSQVPVMDAKAKAAGMNGISALAPNAKPTVPSYTEAKDWNDYLMYFNEKVKKDGITDEELDKGDGSYAQKSFEEYVAQKKLPYKYDEFTKKIQQYWNDVYNSKDPLALMNVRGRYTKEELSKVDGRIGSLTRNYYAPTVNHGAKYNTGEVIGGYRGVPDPYNGGISVFDTNNMSAEEAKKQYLELAAKKINEANKQRANEANNPQVVNGYNEGGVVTAPSPIDFAKATPEQLQAYASQLQAYNNYLSQNTQQTQQATKDLAVKTASDIANTNNVIQQANAAKPTTVSPTQPSVSTNQTIAEGTQPAQFVNPIQPMQEPDTDQMLANVPVVPENDGSQTILDNSKRVQEMLGLTTHKFDEKKAERLKKIAAVNSVGQALSTAFGGYIGTKGGPILNTATDITPKALAEYTSMLEKKEGNEYRTNILKVQEAVRGMHDVAANELANKRANQKLISETQQYINKFKLDKYADNEKYRRDIDAKLFQYGIDVAKIAQKNGYDEEKTKAAVKNQWELARYQQSQMNYRAKLNSQGNTQAPEGMVAFYNPQTGQREYIERSKAMYIIGKAKQERDADNNPVYKMEDLITKPDKFNPEEMGLSFYDLLQKYGGSYTPKSDPLGIVDDANRPPDVEEDPDADLLVQ